MAVGVCFRDVEFSLRLGHTRVLTSHCDVIHYARFREEQAPPLQSLFVCRLCSGRRLFSGRRGAVPYGVCAVAVCMAVSVCFREEQAPPLQWNEAEPPHNIPTTLFFKVLRGSKGNFFKSSPWRVSRVFKRFVLCR